MTFPPPALPGRPSQTPVPASPALTALCVVSKPAFDVETVDGGGGGSPSRSPRASPAPTPSPSSGEPLDGSRPPTASSTPRPSTPTPPLFSWSTPTSDMFTFRADPRDSPATPPRSRSSRHSSSVRPSSGTPQATPPSSQFSFSFSHGASSSNPSPQPTPPASRTPASSLFSADRVVPPSWLTPPAASPPPPQSLHTPRGLSVRPFPAWAHAASAPEAVPVAAELEAAAVFTFRAAELSATPASIHALPVVAPMAPAAPAVSASPAVSVTPAATVGPATVGPAPVSPAPTVPSSAPATPVAELPATPSEYDPRTEPMPQRPFFTPAVQNALRDGMRLAKEAVAAIEAVGADTIAGDADLKRLLAEAKRLQVYQSVQTRTIAVLGSSGKGKSHLINSLLHVPDLALTSDMGDACTSIVTEYHQKRPGQDAPFFVEVEYLSPQEIKEHVRELVRSYRRPYLMAGEDGVGEEDAQVENASQAAWSALSTVFADRPPPPPEASSQEPELTEAWLQDLADGAEETIVATLQGWADEIDWPAGGGGGTTDTANVWTATATDAAACAAQTMRFMGDRHWPFTKTIRVHLASPLLEAGIVLADLPGLEDVNLARMRVTQDYLARCDNILIVDHIARAISSESVRSSIFLALARHVPAEWAASGGQTRNLAVVCTRSEDIDLRAAAARFPDRARLNRLHAAIAAAKRAGDRETEAAKKQEEHILLVRARNDHVRQGLQKTYAKHMQSRRARADAPTGFSAAETAAARAAAAATARSSAPLPPLDVFCVSNTWYEAACPDGNTAAVQASQIPALRRYCYTAAADDQLAEAKHYLRARLPALLAELDLWATSTQARHRADSAATTTQSPAVDGAGLRARTDALAGAMALAAREFTSRFRLLEKDLYAFFEHLRQTWTAKAAAESRKWMVRKGVDRWYFLQYHAWCAHNGDHETPARRANWNRSIIWAMRQDLEYQWDLTLEQAADDFVHVLDHARNAVLSLRTVVAAAAAGARQDGAAMDRLIDLQLANLDGAVDGVKRTFLRELQAIHRCASDANCASYIVQDMAPVYHKALVDSVRLTGNARRDVEERIVDGHIQSGAAFVAIETALQTALDKLVRDTEAQLQQCLLDAGRTLGQNVGVFCRSHARPPALVPARRDDALAARLGALADAVKRLAAAHERLLGSLARI